MPHSNPQIHSLWLPPTSALEQQDDVTADLSSEAMHAPRAAANGIPPEQSSLRCSTTPEPRQRKSSRPLIVQRFAPRRSDECPEATNGDVSLRLGLSQQPDCGQQTSEGGDLQPPAGFRPLQQAAATVHTCPDGQEDAASWEQLWRQACRSRES